MGCPGDRKAAGPTGVVSEMMKASGGFGTRWMIDLINNIVNEVVFQIIGDIVTWCFCTRGKVIQLCAVHIALLSYWRMYSSVHVIIIIIV